jgi:mannose-6-phosphate isomerase-like protein (cupin superfamily)
MKTLFVVCTLMFPLMAADTLAQRIGRYDPSKFRVDKPTHLGTGELHYQSLLPANAVYNLSFMHRGVIMPKSGIGHHIHNNAEEMFLVWDGYADFTIDGHTSRLRGPVGVPQRARQSHGVYNPNNVPVEWMNINFRLQGGGPGGPRPGGPGGPARGGPGGIPSFSADPTSVVNLGDDRSNATLDPVPVFQYTTFYRETIRAFPGYAANKAGEAALALGVSRLQPVPGMNGGRGEVFYERVLGPSTYLGNWAFVDHYVLAAGATLGRHVHKGVEEIYYVMNGEGTVTVSGETEKLGTWDAVPIRVSEIHSFENTGARDLEFMVVGVALEKGKLDSEDVK